MFSGKVAECELQNVNTRLICSSTDDHLNTAVLLQPYLGQQATAHDGCLKLVQLRRVSHIVGGKRLPTMVAREAAALSVGVLCYKTK